MTWFQLIRPAVTIPCTKGNTTVMTNHVGAGSTASSPPNISTGKTEEQWQSAMAGNERRGIQQQIANSLKAWAKPTSRPRDRSQTDGSPRLSRRALLIGAAGLAVASGAARVVASVTHPPAALPTFEQITSQAGIAFRHRRHHSAHAIQAGAAFFDLNETADRTSSSQMPTAPTRFIAIMATRHSPT